MNNIRAKVVGIEASENLHRVMLSAGNQLFTVITLELADDYTVGAMVDIRFKSAHVALAKNITGEVSIANRLQATVQDMQKGKILVDMQLESDAGNFYALTTTEAVERMCIAPGDVVTALMKASDLYLSKVEDA
ncbi:transporter [Prosthecochloris sp. SCSIO W1101]|uniref:TOBE domain-containing protein n=1 Tax=Prosthecochloris sp. SCSIO W1101 TaxID=2992242 RepID=UPI00223D1FE1|nr:transporter [Prosthecochloris sp. SCSIO W1101]UZJ41009.1 transporter [Prosthecochloris sp. SCSIO W1101]